jgi:hypothetical protein
MPETRAAQSVVDAAEQAAAAGDYASAERLLREAVLLQETSLGPLHPDVANTLNNLGVVCERLEKPVEAEEYFRRACAIAAAVFEPDHPFVITSRKNLEDFCAARGRTVDPPRPAPLPEDRVPPPAMTRDRAPEPRPPIRPPSASSGKSGHRPAAALMMVALVVAVIATVLWFRSGDAGEPAVDSAPAVPASSAPASPANPPPTTASAPSGPAASAAARPDADRERAPAAPPAARVSSPPAARGSVAPASPPAATSPSPTGTASAPTAASASRTALVTAAELCSDLLTKGEGTSRAWRCVPPSSPIGTGPLVFYTRVQSPAAMTVEHRWYRDGRLRRAVELAVQANTGSGYRTYSRYTVDGRGEWRVEVRTRDGALLHEERFVVR